MSQEAPKIGKTHDEIFKVLDKISEYKPNGKLDNYDPAELIGEYPGEEVPGVRQI